MSIPNYQLSEIADQDLDEIFEFSETEFGFDQAVEYLLQIETLFNALADKPNIGRERSEIKMGLRSFPINAHVVFYQINADHIRIIRVLHGSRDMPNFLRDFE